MVMRCASGTLVRFQRQRTAGKGRGHANARQGWLLALSSVIVPALLSVLLNVKISLWPVPTRAAPPCRPARWTWCGR